MNKVQEVYKKSSYYSKRNYPNAYLTHLFPLPAYTTEAKKK